MGNCVQTGRNSKNSSAVSPQLRSSPSMNFKVTRSDLVKEKRSDINNDYRFVETLGKGGYGEVKKAINKATGVIRAVKILNRNKHQPEQIEKLLNEINILKTLDHPHIMRIIEFYQDDAKFYLVSEFYDGGELFDRIMKATTFTEVQAAEVMKQIFSGVNYCHKNQIVHRDIKPENMVYESTRPDAPIKIIDFGTSQAFKPGETLQKPLGTCYYVAPEVLSKKYTEKCDVWSCGVLMYFLLAGHPPFVGESEKKILQKVAKGLYEFRDDEWKNISKDAMDLVRKLLEFDPAKRITAEEALNHPWFDNILRNKDAANAIIVNDTLKNLREFRSGKKLQESVWVFLVSYFSAKEETSHLLQTFQALDKDKNGVLSKEEIMGAYKTIWGKAQNDEEIEDMIQKIDNNNSGNIDYSEFVTATINKINLLSKEKLEAAFKLFDRDGNGYLTVEEFKEFLNPDQLRFKKQTTGGSAVLEEDEDKVWEDLMSQIDKNQDGKVSLKEFKDMMLDLLK